MSSERLPGLLLVLSAPSGAGKTTLAHRFRERHREAAFSVSATTRGPRGAERDGVDYHFVTPERFGELVQARAFAEWAEVHGKRYGTLRSTVAEALADRRIALFDIDVQGGSQLAAAFPEDTVTVFVMPPDEAELERRLRWRSTDDDAVIARRLAAAREEIRRGLASYDYVVVNDVLDEALARIEAIARFEQTRRAGAPDPDAARLAATSRRPR